MATRRSAFSPFLQSLSDILIFFGQLATLFLEGCWFVVRGKISVRATLRQMGEVGVGSLFVAIVTVGFSGAVLALYTSIQLVKFGQAGLAGGVIGKSLAL
ncbi:MAG TPA: ABC transporter permease, partial [Abditibacterium sp.]